MTNQEILKRAIEKAYPGAYDIDIRLGPIHFKLPSGETNKTISRTFYSKESLIYSKEFAKAFFGEEELAVFSHFDSDGEDEVNVYDYPTCWEFHLQQMVISPDPIRYLEQFLDDKE